MNTKSMAFGKVLAFAALASLYIPQVSEARGRSVHRNVNVNRNVSRSGYNRNVNVNRNTNVNVDVHNRYYNRGGFGAGLAVGAVTGVAVGAAIATAPPYGYRTVYARNTPYAYYGGVYYQPAATGYVVVAPPVGVIVPTLPPGSTAVVVNGVSCFQFEGSYYQPVLCNGVAQYQVIAF